MLRLATRSSAQASAQARAVADAMHAADPSITVELVFVETIGDQLANVPLHTIGGQGVFVKEVQRAVLSGHADFAVHSAKDLPASPQDAAAGAGDLMIAAFCERRDPRDALVGARLDELAHGATVASGSVRRRAQLAAVRPDLQFVELRGNIETRLGKVPAEGAIVMAVAALQILGLTDRIAEVLDAAVFVPVPGQGCVAVECRADDERTSAAIATVDHLPSRRMVEVERAFLAELGSGCSLPVGAHGSGGRLTAFLASDSHDRTVNRSIGLPDDHREALAAAGRALAGQLLEQLA